MEKRKLGRPKAIIDWKQVGQLLEAGCQAVGIAAMIGVDEDTLRRRCEVDNKMLFTEFTQQKKAKGNDQLHAKQYQTAMSGNTTMLIWLGKQRLGQAEKSEVKNEVDQKVSGSIGVSFIDYRANLSTETEG